jgi:NadR type nicotinamide-nucleotide adenylyltransferase
VSRTICLHGPESTGKTTIAPRIAAALGGEVVAEFGRSWAEQHGTDFSMSALVAIAMGHDSLVRNAEQRGVDPVILDTDPLMTAVWADMLFGERHPWFYRWNNTADLYLLFDIDLPWVDDGTRMFGSPAARQRFFDLSKQELERRGVRWALVTGSGFDERTENAMRAIREAGLG